MSNSSKARKGLAAGLALSTVLMSVSMFVLPVAFAAPHAEGCNVLSSGTVYMISGGQLRGYPSADVFVSHGNGFGGVQTANSEDMALPTGPVLVYADGTLVKGPNDPLVYLVANGQKRGFTSGTVFTGLGFKFSNIQSAPANTFTDLPTGAHMESATERHTTGVWVLDGTGTVWRMTATGRVGLPSMAVFNSWGKSWATVVSANAADMAAANEGVASAKPSCSSTGPITGSVNVTATGSSTTLIVDAESDAPNYSQSMAPLANFNFTGNGTVTSVTIQRTGVSTDSIITGVYLFDGATRLTDAGSFSSGSLTFSNTSGLFTVSGSKTITVRADLDDGTTDNQYVGQTVGVNMTAASLSSGTVGGLTASGSVHTIASASLATVAIGAPADAAGSDPGNDIKVWESTFTVGVRDVTFSRLALRQINNIQASDVRNFRLSVDGVQVASQTNLDVNGYVTFSNFSKVLKTGTPVIKVVADVTGGSSRTLEMSLRSKVDVDLTDSQYNVNVSATGTFPADSDGILISNGSVSVTKATDSPSGTVTNNASNVKLGKWAITAYGEAVKIENLAVAVDNVGETNADYVLRNGKLFVNGGQVGATSSLTLAGAATAAATFTTNFTVTPGTSATVELYADMYDELAAGDELAEGDSIRAYLIDNDTTNATSQVSLSTFDVPTGVDVAANPLTIGVGAMTLTAVGNYTAQTIAIPRNDFKLGAFNLTGDVSETINVHTITINFNGGDEFQAADLSNVVLKYGSSQTTPRTVASGTTVDAVVDFPVSLTLGVNQVVPIEVWANINTFTVAGGNDTMAVEMRATGITQSTSLTVYAPGAASYTNGPTMTAGTGTLTTSTDASNPASSITEDSVTRVGAALKFSAASDSFTVTEMTVQFPSGATNINTVTLKNKDTGAVYATRPGGPSSMVISGLSIPVPANGATVVNVELTLGTVGAGAGTTGENVYARLSAYKASNSQGEQVTEANETFANRDGGALYVFAAVPTITAVAVPNVDPIGNVDVASWTVSPTGGAIAIKQIGFSSTVTESGVGDATLTLGSFKLYRGSTDITDLVAIVNAAGATIEATNTLGEGAVAGYIVFATEEQVNASTTYTLKATTGGAWATNDNLKVEVLSDAVSIRKYLNDAAAGAGIVGALSEVSGANETAAMNFLWSDLSALSHSASTPDDVDGVADAATSTGDWTNGYLVKSLPLTPWTLVY